MDRALRELLRTERHRAQVEERRRRNELLRQAAASVSLRDVVAGLATTAAPVAVATAGAGSVPPAVICEVGRDYVALRDDHDVVRLIPLASITSVAAVGSAPPHPDGVAPGLGAVTQSGQPDVRDLAERLRELAQCRTAICARTTGGVASGRLQQVGIDVLVLTDAAGAPVAVALEQITLVELGP